MCRTYALFDMADAVAVRSGSSSPSLSSQEQEEEEDILSLTPPPPKQPSPKISTKHAAAPTITEKHPHQPRRMEEEENLSTTEGSYLYYDPDGEMSEDSLFYAVAEDRADDMEDEGVEEEVSSTPLSRVTPRSISRRSTEVSY